MKRRNAHQIVCLGTLAYMPGRARMNSARVHLRSVIAADYETRAMPLLKVVMLAPPVIECLPLMGLTRPALQYSGLTLHYTLSRTCTFQVAVDDVSVVNATAQANADAYTVMVDIEAKLYLFGEASATVKRLHRRQLLQTVRSVLLYRYGTHIGWPSW